jgi:hypothetical protein
MSDGWHHGAHLACISGQVKHAEAGKSGWRANRRRASGVLTQLPPE